MAYDDDLEEPIRLGRTIAALREGNGRRFAILRCAKIKTLGNMGASLQHTFRERETPNADPERRADNTILVGAGDSQGVLDAWHARAPEKIRANAVHGLEYFIGGSPGALKAMSREEQDAYFRRALGWLEARHGKENILSAVIHRDEATPHLTVMTIPLDEHGKLNARALVGDRKKLSAMQTDFAERVGKPHGLERGVEGSRATHERVKSAYAHLSDPETAVHLPERRTGTFLGRGKETDAEWRQRASEAATGALAGAWSAMRREQKAHEVKVLALERQSIGTPSMQWQLERLERENRGLTRALEAVNAEADQLDRRLRHMEISRDIAVGYARALGERLKVDEKKLLATMSDAMKEAIKAGDAAADPPSPAPVAAPDRRKAHVPRQAAVPSVRTAGVEAEASEAHTLLSKRRKACSMRRARALRPEGAGRTRLMTGGKEPEGPLAYGAAHRLLRLRASTKPCRSGRAIRIIHIVPAEELNPPDLPVRQPDREDRLHQRDDGFLDHLVTLVVIDFRSSISLL